MPYRILVLAQDLTKPKGYISCIREPTVPWGNKETLPNFIRVEVTDGVSATQAKAWQQQWAIDYIFTVVTQDETEATYTAEVDPDVIAASGKGANELKTEMRDYIEQAEPGSLWYGTTVDGFTTNSMTVTVPKPHSKQALKDDFTDKFQFILEIDRYYFNESGVNWVIGKGGSVSITQVKAMNYIVDRLDE